MIDDVVGAEATLSHVAARLYIHLLWRGGGWKPKAALMRGCGICDYRDFDRAWNELLGKGLLDPQTRMVWPGPVTSTEKSVFSTVWPVPTTEKSVTSTEVYTTVTSTDPVANTEKSVPSTGKSVTNTEKSVASTDVSILNVELDLREADEMPADGDERDMSSNFQLRRKRQLLLLEQAWMLLFPKQNLLQPLTAKQLLIAARSSAMTVFEAMQKAADRGVEYPLGYTKKIIEELAKKKPVEPVELGTDRPVTPEMRASWAKSEEYARKLGITWEDDD
jgi:hypothetical protein